MKRVFAAIIFFLALVSAANATSSLTCTADNGATAYIQLGSVAVSSIIKVEIEVGDRFLSTSPNKGEEIALLQTFVKVDQILIDLSDPNLENIVAQIRLFIAIYDEQQAIAGTLKLDGAGVFPLQCDEF